MDLQPDPGPIQLLVLEDREEDFELAQMVLQRDGLKFEATRVDQLSVLEEALIERDWDIIISDFNLPEFNAMQALEMIREARPDIPFIVVSGSIGEEQAVELMRKGATDYLMKDRLARLARVVRREVAAADLREQHRLLERELRHLQKIEALGSLAGGIAHNFRNVLMAINGYGELAASELPSDHPACENLSQMLDAARRSEQLVDKILKFSRREPASPPRRINLVDVVQNALSLLRATLPSTIQISFEASTPCTHFVGHSEDLEQALVNMCNNSAQAIGSRPGRIELTLDSWQVLDSGASLLPPGRYCRLSIIDDGEGMDPDTMDRIFEPFFTTKPVGEGTGLGLPMAHRVVSELGGGITCTSELGKGTRFDLYFPAAQPPASESAPAQPAGAVSGRGQRILLIDDEQILANLTAAILTQAGYSVTKFYDTSSALSAFRSNPEDYDLLFTDLSMPGMTGLELAAEMHQIRPDLPVVLCSGYVGEHHSTLYKHCAATIPKPYDREVMLAAIQDAMATSDMHKKQAIREEILRT